MIEERERYERAFELFEMPEPAFDRLVLRRERKRRNERLAAGIAAMALVFALALAFGVAWLSSRNVPADRPTPEPSTALPSAPEDWNRVAFPGTGISSIATGGPGLVAVGVDGGDDGTAAGGAIWTSSDGRAWDRVQQEFLNAFSDVTTGGPGLVAVGSQPDPGPVVRATKLRCGPRPTGRAGSSPRRIRSSPEPGCSPSSRAGRDW
jgi:hypothetical protein